MADFLLVMIAFLFVDILIPQVHCTPSVGKQDT